MGPENRMTAYHQAHMARGVWKDSGCEWCQLASVSPGDRYVRQRSAKVLAKRKRIRERKRERGVMV